MPDVFASWSTTLANLRAAGISSHMVKIGSDAAYYNLGTSGKEPKLDINALNAPDSYLKPHGYGFEVDFEIESLQAGSVEVGLLGAIAAPSKSPVALRLALSDTLGFGTTSLLGCGWRLKMDGDATGHRVIDYMYKGKLKKSELDAFGTTSLASVGSTDPGDSLYTLAQAVVRSHEVPNGLTKVEFKASTDAAYVDAGDFKNGKYTFETIGEAGGGGRGIMRNIAIKFNFDVELHQTTDAEMNYFDSIVDNDINLKLTHMDGVVLTLPGTNIGVMPGLSFGGSVDKLRIMKLHAEGALVWNGTSFVTTDGTAWSGIWS